MQLEQHPILFQFSDRIDTDACVLEVMASGRAILTYQYGEWWMYGVNPAIAAPGTTDAAARAAFREAYREALQDIIEEVGQNAADLDRTVRQFINQTCGPDEAVWLQSLNALRSSNATIPEPLSLMERRESKENDVTVEVKINEKVKPAVNPSVVELAGTIEARVSIQGSLEVVPAQQSEPPVCLRSENSQTDYTYALPQAA